MDGLPRTILFGAFSAFSSLGILCCGDESPASYPADPFPALKDLKPPVLMRKNAEVKVDKNGNYLVDGKPRFLVGAQVGEGGLKQECLPTPGYGPDLKWLYEDVPVYENAQRAGLDTIGYYTSDGWIKDSISKDFKSMRASKEDEAMLDRLITGAKLPLYVDYSIMPSWHGALATPSGLAKFKIPAEALNAGGYDKESNHWVPYSATHPEGRKLYRLMWQDGARQIVRDGADVLFYELFNESAYDDPSPYNRGLFVQRLKARYGVVESLNKTWRTHYKSFEEVGSFKSRSDNPALLVEWCKFMEDCFVDLCSEGIKDIKEIDKRPDLAFCVQALGMDFYRVIPNSNVNLYKLSKILNCTSTPTGGGIGGTGMTVEPARSIDATFSVDLPEGMIMRHFLLAISDGKPIHDGEAYIGAHRKGIDNHMWLQLARGGNAAYAFQWGKRGWDKLWWSTKDPNGQAVEGRTPEGGRKMAEIMPYKILNPYAAQTKDLLGLMDFKTDLYKVDDIFVPRENRQPASIAVLLSFPTERYSQASGNPAHNEIKSYAAALEFAHYPIDVLPEEMLSTKLGTYKVLVAGGVENIYPESVKPLKDFVAGGGILVLGCEAMSLDEYGNPADWGGLLDLNLGAKASGVSASELSLSISQSPLLPGKLKAKLYRAASPSASWEALGSANGAPLLFRKAFGKGFIYWIDAKMPEYGLSSLLYGILDKAGIAPSCTVVRSSDGQLSPNLEIQKFSTKDFTGYFIYNWDKCPKLVKFSSPETLLGKSLVDPVSFKSFPISDGQAALCLGPLDKAVLICGSPAGLEHRFGKLAAANPAVEYESLKELAKAASSAKVFKFPVDEAKTVPLDLKPFANRGFEDSIAHDGKGGWTDQGENCLRGVESIWGRQVFCGVPFDIIRYDMNAGNACIVMSSKNIINAPEKVAGIPVGEKVKAIYFLQTTAWTKTGEQAMSYVLHHPDGSTTTVPVVCGVAIDDWWFSGEHSIMKDAHIAWRNSENKGFYAWRWENPAPEKQIDSIDIVSANGDPIPIVIAITIEKL